ncbi:hypothetical protein V1478_003977 [Vespula squamosa]|uniref:Uncharacterized protein n=1 Tax=Vespula squamosa TaxID=30214 RepID=A0ABD2BNX8_VESSQ
MDVSGLLLTCDASFGAIRREETKVLPTNRIQYIEFNVGSIRSNSSFKGHQYPMLAQEAPASAKIRLRVTPTDGSSKQDTSASESKDRRERSSKCLRVVVEVQAKARLPHELIILLGVELHGRMRVEWSRGRVYVSCNAEQRGKK